MKRGLFPEIFFLLTGLVTLVLLAQVFQDQGFIFRLNQNGETSADFRRAEDYLRRDLKNPVHCAQFLKPLDKNQPQQDIYFLFPRNFPGLTGPDSRIRVDYIPLRNLDPPRAKIRLLYFKDRLWGPINHIDEEQILVRKSVNLFFNEQDQCSVDSPVGITP